jgi:hypothetical protein
VTHREIEKKPFKVARPTPKPKASRGAVRVNLSLDVEPFEVAAPRLAKNGYRPLPLPFGKKGPNFKGWRQYEFSAGDKRRHAGAGTGLLCGDLVAVDIDVYDRTLAHKIASLAGEVLGEAPTRVGLAPKSARIYRVKGKPFKKLKTHAYRLAGEDPQSKPHQVEILADGQQLVAFNLHPETRRPYRWIEGRSPLTVPLSRLRSVSLHQAEEFLRRADTALATHGTRIGKFEQAEIAQPASSAELRAANPDELRQALGHIPNDDEDYVDWIRILYAAKGALGEAGRDDLMRWSAKSRKDDPATTAKAWNGAKPDRIGAGTIFFHALRHGWRPASRPSRIRKWPGDLAAEAYQGLIGDIARAIEPETESDPAALVLQTLVAFGATVGRGPHVRVENDQHHGNLFANLVGRTSKARKGTSFNRVREVFDQVSARPNVVTGLSSGEGLKYHVRDSSSEFKRNRRTGKVEEFVVDPGVDDKRLLVVEPELAQVLRQMARPGNTLSPILRCAWDGTPLQSLTKNDPLKATCTHISIIGHITNDELAVELTATDQANGFANRFLFMCVQRSKYLSRGGKPLAPEVLDHLVKRVRRVVENARTLNEVPRTEAALQLWDSTYRRLTDDKGGLFGAVIGRAEAQVLRLSLIYALADGASAIDRCHLEAALAVWDRAEASARYIFGTAVGHSLADDIHLALRNAGAEGMNRTAIRDLFKRHESKERVDAALQLLAEKKLAVCIQQPPEGGRPAEVWVAAEHATDAASATKATKATKVAGSAGHVSHKSLKSQPRKLIRVVKRRDR